MSTAWLAVASFDHVQRGRAGGFMQVCHGKAAPLRRIAPGDGVVYYSPTDKFRDGKRLQAFTAIGVAEAREPYQFDMGGGFAPYRRDVAWQTSGEAPIRPLLGELEFTAGGKNWSYQLRFGLLPISGHDWGVISRAMNVSSPALLLT